MKTRRRYSALVAALALALLVPGAASAVADRESPGPQYPAESCYDAYVDCGYAQVETDVYTESSPCSYCFGLRLAPQAAAAAAQTCNLRHHSQTFRSRSLPAPSR